MVNPGSMYVLAISKNSQEVVYIIDVDEECVLFDTKGWATVLSMNYGNITHRAIKDLDKKNI